MTPADHVNLRDTLQTLLNQYGNEEVGRALEYLQSEEPLSDVQGICKDCGNGTLNNSLNAAFGEHGDESLYCLNCGSTHIDIL
jgi:hypothetical protein